MWLGPVPELLRALLATTYHVPCVSQHRENYESTLSTRECEGEIGTFPHHPLTRKIVLIAWTC
jgi:hypothetical protein